MSNENNTRRHPTHRLVNLHVSKDKSIDGTTDYYISFSYRALEADGPTVDPITPIVCRVNRETLEVLKKNLEDILSP